METNDDDHLGFHNLNFKTKALMIVDIRKASAVSFYLLWTIFGALIQSNIVAGKTSVNFKVTYTRVVKT